MPCHITILYVYSVVSLAALFHATLVAAEIVVIPPSNSTPELKHILDQELSFSAMVPEEGVPGLLTVASPITACEPIMPPPFPSNDTFAWFVLIARFECSLADKARYAQEAGYDVAVIYDRKVHVNPHLVQAVTKHTSEDIDVNIYAVMVSEEGGNKLKRFTYADNFQVKLYPENLFNLLNYLVPFLAIVGLCTAGTICYIVVKYVQDWCKRRRGRLSKKHLKHLATTKYKKGDAYDTCAICIEDYIEGDKLYILPCSHAYHSRCIEPWLLESRRTCPICKRKVVIPGMPLDSDSDSDAPDERTPLLSDAAVLRTGTFPSASGAQQHPVDDAGSSQSPSTTSVIHVTVTRANLHGEETAAHSCPTNVSTAHSVNFDTSMGDDEDVLVVRSGARSKRKAQRQRREQARRARRGEYDAEEVERLRRAAFRQRAGDNDNDLHRPV